MRTKTPNLASRMLEAAARLFGTRRFHEVRMEDIAADAEVSKGTLYRYFKDKEEMYLALLERASGQYLDQLRQELARADGARAQLTALVAAVIEFFDTHPHLLELIQRAEVLRGPNEAFPWQRARDESLRLVLEIFRDASRRQEFTVRDPNLAALMLLGGIRSLLRFGTHPRPADLPARIVEHFLHGADERTTGGTGSTGEHRGKA